MLLIFAFLIFFKVIVIFSLCDVTPSLVIMTGGGGGKSAIDSPTLKYSSHVSLPSPDPGLSAICHQIEKILKNLHFKLADYSYHFEVRHKTVHSIVSSSQSVSPQVRKSPIPNPKQSKIQKSNWEWG